AGGLGGGRRSRCERRGSAAERRRETMGQIPAIEGTCDARFARVRDAFADNFATHDELGAGVAVVLDGQTVVDLWGGHADVGRTRAWRHDTLCPVSPTTKGVVALGAPLPPARRPP